MNCIVCHPGPTLMVSSATGSCSSTAPRLVETCTLKALLGCQVALEAPLATLQIHVCEPAGLFEKIEDALDSEYYSAACLPLRCHHKDLLQLVARPYGVWSSLVVSKVPFAFCFLQMSQPGRAMSCEAAYIINWYTQCYRHSIRCFSTSLR